MGARLWIAGRCAVIALRGFAIKIIGVVVGAAWAVATAQSPEPVPQAPAVTNDDAASAALSDRDAEREALRAEFIEARSQFARVTADALTSDELKNWVRGISQRVRLRRTEEDLWEVRAALDHLNRSGRADADRAERLAQREAELSREVERLQAPDGVTPAGGVAMPDQATVRNWIEREMAEETNHLADTLSDRDLVRRTRRLHRLATLAQFARRFQEQRQGPQAVSPHAGEIVPAGGVEAPSGSETRRGKVENADASELGEPTAVPPELPAPAPKKGTTAPDESRDDAPDQDRDEDAQDGDSSPEASSPNG